MPSRDTIPFAVLCLVFLRPVVMLLLTDPACTIGSH